MGRNYKYINYSTLVNGLQQIMFIKQYTYIIVIAITLVSCSKNISGPATSIAISSEKHITTYEEVLDSICKTEILKANKDIENNVLKYSYPLAIGNNYKPKNEMDSLLSHYNISTDIAIYNCTDSGKFQNCYSSRMLQEIQQRYGEQFIDSLKNIADIQYIKNNINKVFYFHDCDTISRYPNAKSYRQHFENSKKDFFANVPYPEGFQYKNEEHYSYITANFILYKDGHINDIDIQVTFQNEANNKFISYYIDRLRDFILATKWISATSHGISVDSEVPLTILFK